MSLLPSQPDGERGLPEDVSAPTCCCCLGALRCGILRAGRPRLALDKLIWWWCSAMSSVEVKSGSIGEALPVVVRCEHMAVLPSPAEPTEPTPAAQRLPRLPLLAPSARCGDSCTQSRCKRGFGKEAVQKRQRCRVKSESLVSNCFGKKQER